MVSALRSLQGAEHLAGLGVRQSVRRKVPAVLGLHAGEQSVKLAALGLRKACVRAGLDLRHPAVEKSLELRRSQAAETVKKLGLGRVPPVLFGKSVDAASKLF